MHAGHEDAFRDAERCHTDSCDHIAAAGAESDALRAARFTATYWRDEIMARDELRRTGMSHPLACVLAALDGETEPIELGIAQERWGDFRAALATSQPDPLPAPVRHASGDDLEGCVACYLDEDGSRCFSPERDPEHPGLCRWCSHTVEAAA